MEYLEKRETHEKESGKRYEMRYENHAQQQAEQAEQYAASLAEAEAEAIECASALERHKEQFLQREKVRHTTQCNAMQKKIRLRECF